MSGLVLNVSYWDKGYLLLLKRTHIFADYLECIAPWRLNDCFDVKCGDTLRIGQSIGNRVLFRDALGVLLVHKLEPLGNY